MSQNQTTEENAPLSKTPNGDYDYVYEALGWMYAEACVLADKGVDIRQVDASEFIPRMEKDLGIKKPH